MSKRFRRTLVVLGLLACWTVPAYAAWVVNAETAASFSSGTLQPPTGLTVSRACAGEGLADYTLEWTPSTSLYAEGYNLRRYIDGAPDGTWVITPASTAIEIQTDVSVDPGGFTYSWELETFAGSWSSAAATASDAVESPPPCSTPPSSGLHVEYRTSYTDSTSNTIGPQLRIHNTGSSPVPLSELTVRYWFTREGTTALNYACDWAQVNCANITGAFTQLGTPVAGADHYLQLSFGGGAGSIAAGGNSGEIHSRFHKTDWSNFNQADDWSFDATKTAYAQWERVTLYHNGVLVWGVEPDGSIDPEPPGDPEISIQYRDNDGNPNNAVINPFVQLHNTGAGSVPMSDLEVRYWFTRDSNPALQFHCDWAQVGCANITGAFANVNPALPSADRYLRLTFSGALGSLPGSGGTTGDIQFRITKVNNSNFNENNDWSYRPSTPAFVEWDRITVYRNGVLIWGVEP